MDLFQSFRKLCVIKIWILSILLASGRAEISPLVLVTWGFANATQKAWDVVYTEKRSALDAVEESCTVCEQMQCGRSVGFGGKPDENGEITLDALIMDGITMDVGAVAGIRNVKDAISVARKVMEKTRHSLLAGGLAADFAVQMGFKKESLQTNASLNMWQSWKENNCQPNFWENVEPDPSKSCGPYRLSSDPQSVGPKENIPTSDENNHDTIGTIALDTKGHVAAGVSTNGQLYKIPGRIGDSAMIGAGAYADDEVGAVAATGYGDIIMRFLPSYLSVELMRMGISPQAATETTVRRVAKREPKFRGALIALNKDGEHGAACYGYPHFPYYVANVETGGIEFKLIPCITLPNTS